MKNLSQILRKEVVAICGTVFMADVVSGIVLPSFSLYAASIGASLTLIGVLSGVAGLTAILSSVPIGAISDARGRKNVISVGMLLFTASSFLYTIVPTPIFLVPVRVLAGLAMVSTFSIGIAYVGDVVTKHERGVAVGLYTTSMGLGFAVGPALGGLVAAAYGYQASYLVAALFSGAGFAIARWGLASPPLTELKTAGRSGVSFAAKLQMMMGQTGLLAASLANLVNSVVFSTIFSFFPLFAASLALGEATLGLMFAIRALASTVVRLPTGLLATRFSNRLLMMIALSLDLVIVISIAYSATPFVLGLLLAGEGIAYGMFLTSGQSFVTGQYSEANRGTAIGVYNATGSIGMTAGPLILGIVAEWWGLIAVFQVTAVMVLAGIGAMAYIWVRQRRISMVETERRLIEPNTGG